MIPFNFDNVMSFRRAVWPKETDHSDSTVLEIIANAGSTDGGYATNSTFEEWADSIGGKRGKVAFEWIKNKKFELKLIESLK